MGWFGRPMEILLGGLEMYFDLHILQLVLFSPVIYKFVWCCWMAIKLGYLVCWPGCWGIRRLNVDLTFSIPHKYLPRQVYDIRPISAQGKGWAWQYGLIFIWLLGNYVVSTVYISSYPRLSSHVT